jgi:transcriptional regulator with XRE-family HTH domain
VKEPCPKLILQNQFDSTVGSLLSEHRKSLKISQEYLSSILRKDQTFISKVENGNRTISLYDFIRWITALNLSDADIIKIINGGR